jgi:hypothetical protein
MFLGRKTICLVFDLESGGRVTAIFLQMGNRKAFLKKIRNVGGRGYSILYYYSIVRDWV